MHQVGVRLGRLAPLALRLLGFRRLWDGLVRGIVKQYAAAGITGDDLLIAADLIVLLRPQQHMASRAILRNGLGQCCLARRRNAILMSKHCRGDLQAQCAALRLPLCQLFLILLGALPRLALFALYVCALRFELSLGLFQLALM